MRRRYLTLLVPFASALIAVGLACSESKDTNDTEPTPDGTAPTPTTSGTTSSPPVDSGGDANRPDTGDARGACTTRKVLVLGHGETQSVTAARQMLENVFQLTVVPNYSTHEIVDGGDASVPSTFDAVFLMSGEDYPPMPSSLQRALLDAHARGAGILFEEWSAYCAQGTCYPQLLPLMLYRYVAYNSGGRLTLTATDPSHPVWAGLPGTFTTVAPVSMGYDRSDAGSEAGATVIARADIEAGAQGRDVVYVKDGVGRIAQTTIASNYLSDDSLANDPNVKQLYLNLIKWVARCE